MSQGAGKFDRAGFVEAYPYYSKIKGCPTKGAPNLEKISALKSQYQVNIGSK